MIKHLLFSLALFCASFSLPAQTNWYWANSVHVPSSWNNNFRARVQAVCTDQYGNCYATGTFDGDSVTFGSITLPDQTLYSQEIFVVKYDWAGNELWAMTSVGGGPNLSSWTSAITVDSMGNVIVTGAFSVSTITFGSITLTKTPTTYVSTDLFILKLDPNGNELWAHNYGNDRSETGTALAVDSAGYIWMLGRFERDSISFGSFVLYSAPVIWQQTDICLVRFDPSGNPLWASSIIGNNDEEAFGLTLDGQGNAYVGGSSRSPQVTIGTLQMSDPNSTGEGFIVKYNVQGTALWYEQVTGPGGEWIHDIDIDQSGNLYIVGSNYADTSWFDGIPLFGDLSCCYVSFVAKYDSLGNAQWVRGISGGQLNMGLSITVSSSSVYALGHTDADTVDFGNNVGIAPQNFTNNSFVVRFDPYGNDLCYAFCPADLFNWFGAKTIASDHAGGAVIGDGYFGPTAVGSDSLTESVGGYVARFYCNGEVGIEEANTAEQVSIFPNPSDGRITLKMKSAADRLTIYNSIGQIVFEQQNCPPQVGVDLSNHAQGVYVIVVQNGLATLHQKFILY